MISYFEKEKTPKTAARLQVTNFSLDDENKNMFFLISPQTDQIRTESCQFIDRESMNVNDSGLWMRAL
jgi:hypothetical protein